MALAYGGGTRPLMAGYTAQNIADAQVAAKRLPPPEGSLVTIYAGRTVPQKIKYTAKRMIMNGQAIAAKGDMKEVKTPAKVPRGGVLYKMNHQYEAAGVSECLFVWTTKELLGRCANNLPNDINLIVRAACNGYWESFIRTVIPVGVSGPRGFDARNSAESGRDPGFRVDIAGVLRAPSNNKRHAWKVGDLFCLGPPDVLSSDGGATVGPVYRLQGSNPTLDTHYLQAYPVDPNDFGQRKAFAHADNPYLQFGYVGGKRPADIEMLNNYDPLKAADDLFDLIVRGSPSFQKRTQRSYGGHGTSIGISAYCRMTVLCAFIGIIQTAAPSLGGTYDALKKKAEAIFTNSVHSQLAEFVTAVDGLFKSFKNPANPAGGVMFTNYKNHFSSKGGALSADDKAILQTNTRNFFAAARRPQLEHSVLMSFMSSCDEAVHQAAMASVFGIVCTPSAAGTYIEFRKT